MYASYKQTEMAKAGEDYIFKQLFEKETSTYTYLLADKKTKEAVLIDPVHETAERDVKVVKELGLSLKYALNTHMHADHITGTGELKKLVPSVKSVISEASGARADVKVKDGDTLQFGKFKLDCRLTPGHTAGCMTYVWHQKGMVFTGDALLIRACGRTDFQQGSSESLYESVHKKIFTLPDETLVFPGHDYKGFTVSTVGEEKKHNPRLTKTLPEFKTLMKNLNLPYPKKIDASLPANMVDGLCNLELNEKTV
ncbi:hypothetical protein NP493_45g05018 [Ridgeia piscesae]|uniref:Persulfide dioxygenase ETHE1, mitochondrial n=1 Tax=Ridgeia piscesae TaxID=27915 RepID=A0AAD9PBK2_RIDPI|nr:hypothetical protein NP493_45g05018 [Ridgeia piscesae]